MSKSDAKKFKKAIADLGLMQIEFAALIDRDPQTINNYCNGRLPVNSLMWPQIEQFKTTEAEELKRMAQAKLRKQRRKAA